LMVRLAGASPLCAIYKQTIDRNCPGCKVYLIVTGPLHAHAARGSRSNIQMKFFDAVSDQEYMTVAMNDKYMNPGTRPLLSIPPEAEQIHDMIMIVLRQMRDAGYSDCINDDFRRLYLQAMELYADYQRITVKASGKTISCGSGCWICCCHYAEDIYSFEAEIISCSLKKLPAEERARIKKSCEKAVCALERLRPIVSEKLLLDEYRQISADIDADDILLSSYYQLKNRCPFLDDRNLCLIYAIRPLTCRAYINLGDPSVCPPEMINEADTSTYILDLNEEANDILDELHFRYERYPRDTSLCSLVLKYLSEGQ